LSKKNPVVNVYTSEPMVSSSKRALLWRNILGLVICAAISVAAFLLDQNGINLLLINKTQSVMFAICILFACIGGYYILMLLSIYQIHAKHGGESEITMLDRFWRVLTGLSLLIGAAYLLGRLDAFTSFMTMFGGLLLGWSLQAPVSGFAAWIMVTLIRPYRIGDRVQFPNLGLVGDVVNFSYMYLTLNQVGGSIGSEDPIGRMVHVPNAMLFGQVVINYTHLKSLGTSSYILDEALFRVTFDSDWDSVENILLDTARMVTKDIIEKTGSQPYIRADTWDYGTLFRLRYVTDATDRPRIMYEIVKEATKQIQRNRNVDLAIPYVYSFKRGLDGGGGGTRTNSQQSETVEQIDISLIHGIRLEDAAYWKENDSEVNEIAQKVNELGLLQPIVITRDMEGDGYKILLGEKRLKACVLLGWKKIPAIVRNPIGTDINRS
jgi:small-conductance mechanosensitive channel